MSEIQKILGKFRKEGQLENGKKISVKVLNMTAGIGVARKLLAVIAPAVGGTLDGLKHDDIIHGAPKDFTDLSLTLCSQIDKIQVESLIDILLTDLTVDGVPVDIEEYFAGNYGELIEILEFSLKVNFSTFFTGKGIKARFFKTIQTLMGSISPESEEQ